MNLTHPSEVRDLLARLDFKPSKVLGQNFLIDENILNILIHEAQLTPADQVLEVGPGLGVVTRRLLEKSARVVAIERDERLGHYLQSTLGHDRKLELHLADATESDFASLARSGVTKLVSNLPYSVGSRILMDIFEAEPRLDRMVVTVQLEVADRLAAAPGGKDYGLLSVCAQLHYRVANRKVISAGCFFPPPQVKSAIVVLSRLDGPPAPLHDASMFRRLVRAAFAHRRKQIGTILRGAFPDASAEQLARALADAEISGDTRPERIPVAQWCGLANGLRGLG